MAIPAVNASYVGNGVTANGQRVADQTSGKLSQKLVAYGSATLDGVATTFTFNWVDGTITPFGTWSGPAGNQTLTAAKPALAVASRVFSVNGTDDTAPAATTAVISAVTTTGCTITISAAGANGNVLSVVVEIWPYV